MQRDELAALAKRLEFHVRQRVEPSTRDLVLLINETGFVVATTLPTDLLVRTLEELIRRAKARASEGLIVVPGAGRVVS